MGLGFGILMVAAVEYAALGVVNQPKGDVMEEEKKGFGEQMWLCGHELMEAVKKIVSEGNARSVILWSEEGKKLLEIPLSGGLAIGGLIALSSPLLAGVAVIAGLATKVRLEVVPRE